MYADLLHVIHDMTLEDLRIFFDPKATADNGIPCFNRNTSVEGFALKNAPSMRKIYYYNLKGNLPQ